MRMRNTVFSTILIASSQVPTHVHEQHAKAAPNVVYAQLKFMWASGERPGSIVFMRQFAESLTRDLNGRPERPGNSAASKARMDELSKLLARCHLKLGEWQVEMGEDWSTASALSYYRED